jgi:DNA-binding MarR family transcriptional regulator
MARPPIAGAPPAVLLGDHTGYLLHRAGFLLNSAVEQALAPLNLTGRKFFALTALQSLAPLSLQELSQLFALDKALVLAMVDEFEESGVVRRQPSTVDRRRKDLVLTRVGIKLLARATAMVNTVEESFLDGLGPRQRATLHRLLTVVLREDTHA